MTPGAGLPQARPGRLSAIREYPEFETNQFVQNKQH